VFFFSVFLLILLLFDNYFSINVVKVIVASKKQSPLQIENLKGANLLLLSTHSIQNHLLFTNPQLKKVVIQKEFPHTIVLSMEFYDPLIVLEVSQGFLSLSSDGKVLYKTHQNTSHLPVIHYYQRLNYQAFSTGDTVYYKDIQTALYFLKKMNDLGYHVNTIDIGSVDMIAFNLDKNKIIFGVQKDKNAQEYELEILIKQLKIQGREFKTIDLRFDKPIITFQ